MDEIKETFVDLQGLPAKFISYGKGIEESPKKILLFLPGSPGKGGFYREFLEYTHQIVQEKSNLDFSIWCLGHAGVDSDTKHHIPPLKGNEKTYSLSGQIEQKKEFIRRYIPDGCELTLVGHSIGAKMALDLFKHFNSTKEKSIDIKNFFGLFPVFERISETPAGKFYRNLAGILRPLLLLLMYMVEFLPFSIKAFIVKICTNFSEQSFKMTEEMVSIIDWKKMEKVLYLLETEIKTVKELSESDLDFIKSNSEKIWFYYGIQDRWCPLDYCVQLKKKVPDLLAIICRNNIPHAFVLERGKDMAEIFAEWIMNKARI